MRTMFLIPSIKVYNGKYSRSGQNVARLIHDFLNKTFGGYTCASGNIYGYFTSEHTEYDELREFRVAFQDTVHGTKLRVIKNFLASLCTDIGEGCIYLERGNLALLVYPKNARPKKARS